MTEPPLSTKVVISQSMYFPWVGLLEQVRLSNIFIHYDDVQFTRGFYNRVQIKTSDGIKWLTVPLRDLHRGQQINQVVTDDRTDWRSRHRDLLRQAYLKAPYRDDMLELVDTVFNKPLSTLSDISRESIHALIRYFDLIEERQFFNSVDFKIDGSSSKRLLNLSLAAGAKVYLTGHGARNYLEHELFEKAGLTVFYMNYELVPYPQLHGDFNPYVTALDLVANMGKEGATVICSNALNWRKFLHASN